MIPTTEDILAAGMIVFDRPISKIKERTRKSEIVLPRQIVQYMCWRFKTDALRVIAEKTGVTNHATILHAYREVSAQTAIYQRMADYVTKMERVLGSFGFDMGKEVPKGTAPWHIETSKGGKAKPVRITDIRTGRSIVTESIADARRLTGLNETSIQRACAVGGKTRGHFKYEYNVKQEQRQWA